MTIARKSVISVCCRLIGLVIGMMLLIVSIQIQEAYAERKKVSGTCKVITQLERSTIRYGVPGEGIPFYVYHEMLNSDHPDWDNVQRFSSQYDDLSKGDYFKVYGVDTHPNGDQTFFKIVGTRVPLAEDGTSHTWKSEGFFIKGTGKFKGIKGRIVQKGKWSISKKTCEWEAEYEMK